MNSVEVIETDKNKEEKLNYREQIIKLIDKYYEQITKKYNFYNYTINEILRKDFNYKDFLTEINFDAFNGLVQLPEDEILIFLAAILGDIEIFKTIPDLTDKVNLRHPISHYTPVMYAAKYGKLESVKYLMSHQANINYVSLIDNKNAIALAIENVHIEIVSLLFTKGANAYNSDILMLGYKHNAIDVIKMVENYYYTTATFGKYHIKDIISLFVQKIALDMPYEININNKKKNKKKNKIITKALRNMLNNRISSDDVVAFINLSHNKNAKEGLLFTENGIYINYTQRKNIVKLYQPYFVIEKILFSDYGSIIDNILATTINSFEIKDHYDLSIPFINHQEMYKCLYTINDIVKRQA